MIISNNQVNYYDLVKTGESWKLSIEAFLSTCRARNLSDQTLNWYDDVIAKYFYLDFCAKLKIDGPNKVNIRHIELWIEKMKKEKMKASSINTRLRAVRVFFNFLADNNYIENKLKIKLLKEDDSMIEVLTTEQIQTLVAPPPGLSELSFAKYRDWITICLLLDTGIRLGSLVEIRIRDLDFENNFLKLVKTKTRKSYKIPLSPRLKEILTAYINLRIVKPEDYLICNQFGQRIGHRTVQDRVKEYCADRLGADQRAYCHLMRHSMAVQFLRQTGDIVTLQRLLGHSTLDMTLKYSRLNDDDIALRFSGNSLLDNASSAAKTGRTAIRTTKKRK